MNRLAEEKRKRARRRGLAAAILVPTILYHAFFWSLENPPGRPPPGGDGDWALLGYLMFLPGLFLTIAILCGIGLVAARLAQRDDLSRERDERR